MEQKAINNWRPQKEDESSSSFTLNSQFSTARDFSAGRGRHASVKSDVFRLDVLEDQGQRVLVVLTSDK